MPCNIGSIGFTYIPVCIPTTPATTHLTGRICCLTGSGCSICPGSLNGVYYTVAGGWPGSTISNPGSTTTGNCTSFDLRFVSTQNYPGTGAGITVCFTGICGTGACAASAVSCTTVPFCSDS